MAETQAWEEAQVMDTWGQEPVVLRAWELATLSASGDQSFYVVSYKKVMHLLDEIKNKNISIFDLYPYIWSNIDIL